MRCTVIAFVIAGQVKLFSLQLQWVSTLAKYITPSLPMLPEERFKLFSLQLLWVSASAKCFTPISLMKFLERFILFSLQLLWVSASAKYFTPSSSILLLERFNLRSLLSLLSSSRRICLQPSDTRSLSFKSKLIYSFWLSSKFITPTHSTGLSLQSPKSAALKPIWRSLVCKIGSSTLIS